MAYFLFIAYLSAFLLLLHFLIRKKIIHISWPLAASGFLLKVIMGCLYGILFLTYYGGDDTWMYFHQSLDETRFLKQDTPGFLHSLLAPHQYTRYMMNTWWQELEYASLIKLLAILNLFSGSSYYVDVVLFSAITFWGSYFFYRLFSLVDPSNVKRAGLVIFFFIPLVFWTSGIRKDGMIWLWSGLFFLALFRFFQVRQMIWLILAILSLFLVALNRSFVAIGLLPIVLAWTLSLRGKPLRSFATVYAISIVVFFLTHLTGPIDLPQAFVHRQQDFMALQGGSRVELGALEPQPASFIRVLPEALNHVFLRPYPGESGGGLYTASMLETYFVLFVMMAALLFPRPDWRDFLRQPLVLALVAFVISNYLLVGYTIPFLGAIVRYRIIFEGILLVLAVLLIDPARLPWRKNTSSKPTYK